ncbi:gamma-glutamylcyclotransferase family protein [Chitiniphilus eburneus]|uniref:gamma-glutamylcyclotransferase family protein n=1 Tax=Chitiniphilus eburneus TaxID=2571148 RepID=UPI001B7FC9A4|nr:gamma-glutamylcyclotransferase family protein [Chitiniphilus eburneus]
MNAPILVFVYGTLKRGGWNHHWLNGAPCLGVASTVAHYSLYAHSYPFLVKAPRYPVRGELYAVDAGTLHDLDRLEGHPDDYLREQIDVRGVDGETVRAWAYFHPRPDGVLLAEGEFRKAQGSDPPVG